MSKITRLAYQYFSVNINDALAYIYIWLSG